MDVVCWHPNGHYLATGSSDHTVRLWDLQTGQTQRVLAGHRSAVSPSTALSESPVLTRRQSLEGQMKSSLNLQILFEAFGIEIGNDARPRRKRERVKILRGQHILNHHLFFSPAKAPQSFILLRGLLLHDRILVCVKALDKTYLLADLCPGFPPRRLRAIWSLSYSSGAGTLLASGMPRTTAYYFVRNLTPAVAHVRAAGKAWLSCKRVRYLKCITCDSKSHAEAAAAGGSEPMIVF